MQRPRAAIAFLVRRRAALLLAALVCFIVAFPHVQREGRVVLALDAGLVALSAVVVASMRRHHGWTLPIVLTGGGAIVLLLLGELGLRGILVPAVVSIVVFNAVAAAALMAFVMDRSPVTSDKILGAIAAYLLVALAFAGAYVLLERLSPGSFAAATSVEPDGRLDWFDLFYFSMTVLTSTGFGEIVAVSDTARSLVLIEQVVGVMYVAFLVARLANLYQAPRPGGS